MKVWTLLAALAAAILFAVALNDAIYEATSPSGLAWHVVLRKTYSVAAFALVGYLLRRALGEHARMRVTPISVWGMAAYSAAIELGQAAVGSHEGLVWNAVDVACGALGGAIACADLIFRGHVGAGESNS
jgi:hypothetical protein